MKSGKKERSSREMDTPADIKFLTYEILEDLNDKAIRKKLNRSLNFEKLPIEKHELYPVVFEMVHNDREMRVQFMLNKDGATAWLDMTFEDFDRLPTKRQIDEAVEWAVVSVPKESLETLDR